MSSQKVEISSNDEFSDNANNTAGDGNEDMLHPNWNNLRRDVKNKAKSTCGIYTNKGTAAQQVLFYKQKAHQSFMQVIQVQQLHEQEIDQLRQEYQNKIISLQNQLKCKNQMIEIFQKNTNHHLIDFQKILQTQDLGLIQCMENNFTRFDESTILTFKEFLSQKQGDAKIQSMKQNLFTYITSEVSKYLSNPNPLINNIKKQITSIFDYVKEIRQQLLYKVESHQALLKKYEQIDLNHKKLKSLFESVQKDANSMSQNLRKLKEQKNNLQRKNSQLQKKIAQIEKEVRMNHNSKEALLKTSLRQNSNAPFNPRNLLSSQRNIVKNVPGRLNTFKSHVEFEVNKNGCDIKEQNNEQAFLEGSNLKCSLKNQESFDVHDLMAEINNDDNHNRPLAQKNQKNQKYQKNQKRSHLMVSLPQACRIRRKSYEN